MTPRRLSGILQDRFGIPQDMIDDAVQSAKRHGETLAASLVRKQIVNENTLLQAFEYQYELPIQNRLDARFAAPDFTRLVSIGFLKQNLMVPIIKAGGNRETQDGDAMIAMNDPSNLPAVDDLISRLDLKTCRLVLAPKEEILSTINNFYDRKSDNAQKIVDDMAANESIIKEIEQISDILDDTSDAPIIKLVNHIISQSVKAKASDIHIEPGPDTLRVRYRIDGILYDLIEPPKWIQSSLITRIKVMANMDIAEKRLPQDSRIEVRIGNRDIDIRISTIPTALGERVVMRLLDKSGVLLTLGEFGIAQDSLAHIRKLATLPNGIVLMTGPTGSGKTTSLYAMLSEINTPDINIITVEDPVEYKLPGISQIQINPRIGLTFAKSLRSIVRQDPDVILIGEIRDNETAAIAVQSALTGHLVFSTLHTNDSAGAITRLVDIGIEPFLITSAVRAVIAQRLVRLLCDECKTPYVPDALTLQWLGQAASTVSGNTVYRAKGCEKCFHTGYKGRMPIFEIMDMDSPLKSLVLQTSDASQIRALAIKNGMTPLLQDGVNKVVEGITSIEEVLRVTQA